MHLVFYLIFFCISILWHAFQIPVLHVSKKKSMISGRTIQQKEFLMFYYMMAPFMVYNYFLVLAAVIPAAALLIWTYKADKLEKESGRLLLRLVIAGVLSSLIALVLERLFSWILGITTVEGSRIYNIILYFIIVAFAEEGSKYFMLWRRTWKNPEFNCLYDGVVYAVFISLGFAIWENISYVLTYGFSTALIRAVTAIPGHACFGVFMGIFYAFARKNANQGLRTSSIVYRILCVVIPALIHGAYDYIATMQTKGSTWYFLIFIAVLFVISFILVGKMSKKDQRIT